MKKTIILLIITLFYIKISFGQEKEKIPIVFGIQYYGELGFHPGVEVDYQHNLFEHKKVKNKRSILQQINFRPSIAYYNLPDYTNNFLVTPNLDYHLRIINNEKKSYFFVEPYIKFGYQRYFFKGTTYETTNSEFEERKLSGGNSFVFGSGLSFGGSIKPNKLDWILGVEYLREISEGALFIHHINFKVGVRYKIQRK